jgi:hypothetical protein
VAATVHEIQDWLSQFDDDEEIGVDDGGLALQLTTDPEQFFEVGGVPEIEELEP